MPKMKIDTYVFDGSGTILDDLFAVWNANSDAYEAYGFKRIESIEKFKEAFRLPIPEFHRANGIPEDIMDEVERSYRRFYPKYSNLIKIFPEVKGVLEKLKQKEVMLGVASNIPSLFLKEHLQKFEILEYFDAITGQDDCNEQKPSPKPILITLEKLKAKPKQSAYVGDMEEDIIAGMAAKVYTIAINREGSYHPTWKLQRQNPDYFISDLNEILTII